MKWNTHTYKSGLNSLNIDIPMINVENNYRDIGY